MKHMHDIYNINVHAKMDDVELNSCLKYYMYTNGIVSKRYM